MYTDRYYHKKKHIPLLTSSPPSGRREGRAISDKSEYSGIKPYSKAKRHHICSGIFLAITLLAFLAFPWNPAQAQRYRLTSSKISFFSSAPIEDIEAHTSKAQSIFDAQTSEIAFVIPIKGFQFAKSLMQEHFNENYMESDKYPNAKFEGKLVGFKADASDKQQVTAKGQLTIHGVTHEVEIPGEVQMGHSMMMHAKFPVKLVDYQIEIPKVVFYNIAEVVDVTVNFTYETDQK